MQVEDHHCVSGAPPVVSEVGVLALVPDRIMSVWTTRLHVLSHLARYFHVVWCPPAREWHEGLTPRQKREEATDVPLPPGFIACPPDAWPPAFHRPQWLSRFSMRARLKRARLLLERRGCRRIILYLWRPEFAGALGEIASDLTCYHIDDEYSFSESDVPLSQEEAQLISRVDQVFIHSPGLLVKKGGINPNTAFAPNGVDFRAFATLAPEPLDLAVIPRPRIGYSGIIKTSVDWSLLVDLARRHSDWSFVFVGPRTDNGDLPRALEDLTRIPNAYFLGPKDVRTLGAYTQHFDVCVMPYRTNDYTKYVYPLKLHEYLASGRPIVGTAIRTLEDFSKVVRLATTLDQWSSALRDALSPEAQRQEQQQERQSEAHRHDWDILVRGIALILAARLGPEYAERIRESD
jgi:glycosyltransferase involved in cell wall biosynthesis